MTSTLTAVMTDQQRAQFDEDGYLLIRGALSDAEIGYYTDAFDRVCADEVRAGRLRSGEALHLLAGLTSSQEFLNLLNHPVTFPLIWGTLGWNIHLFHSHLDLHPPLRERQAPVWRWHQDGYRQNVEPETNPRPRLAVKAGYWLSDVSEPGRGNLMVIPGSHLRNTLPKPEHPELGFDQPDGAIEVLAKPGDAIFFDRRLWHSRSENYSAVTRKVVFAAYTYRWISGRDEHHIKLDCRCSNDLSPVRRQLLGGEMVCDDDRWGFTGNEAPLRAWLRERGLLNPSLPYLR